MEKILFCLISHLLISFCFKADSTNLCTDESALLEFKDHLNLEPQNYGLTNNWSLSTPICNWVGVSCGVRHKRVTSLNLANMNLKGSIPPSVGCLSFLVSLNISSNQFYGHLPQELSNLRRLRIMDFDSNKLTGVVPSWFGNLPKLQALHLSHNTFTGSLPLRLFNVSSLQNMVLSYNNLSGSLPDDLCHGLPRLEELDLYSNVLNGSIPSKLEHCTRLEIFDLGSNFFITGEIPKSIANLTAIKTIFLIYNSLTGEIPESIGQLRNLEKLALFTNNITGRIPPSLFNMSRVRVIDLGTNFLSGNLPSDTGRWLPNLEELYLGENYFTGMIPTSISNASRLKALDLVSNSFSGSIPDIFGTLRELQILNLPYNNLTIDSSSQQELQLFSSLANCLNLRVLVFSFNSLNISLPASVGNLSTSLEIFILIDCGIRGNLPTGIGNLSSLTVLNLSYNRLTGTIPATLRKLQALQRLILNSNYLEGPIAPELCELKYLGELWLSRNRLSQSIPACLGNLSSLRYLHLHTNRLSSVIPLSVWTLSFVLDLSLATNSLNGSLPLDIGNLKAARYIDLSKNHLSGDLPSINDIQELSYLSLAYNEFQGSIPESFGSLSQLELLNLSNNNLTGEIPKSLERLSNLRYLNLSFNKLEGEIPNKGPFLNFSAQSFSSNLALCGSERFQAPPCKSIGHERSNRTLKLVLLSILPVVATVVLVIALFIKFRNQWKNSPIVNEAASLTTWRRLSYLELQKATDGFHGSNLLGKGAFGSVYKGRITLDRNEMNIAVKVFNLQIEGGFRSFDTECEILSKIRHRNLIKVISCCCNLDFKAIVFDLMANGGLEKWIYSENYVLDLLQRLNIMIDVATALEYLHHGYTSTIVHCDLKPSNILLDEDMVAHVADFGITKLVGAGDSIVQTMTLATVGYMAPEYGREGIVSSKGDIYSFGILLMETFTRVQPTHEMFSGEMSMKHWVKEALSDDVIEVVDANLVEAYDVDPDAKVECISSILILAVACASDSPEEKMQMTDVLSEIRKIKEKYLKDVVSTVQLRP
ncbi:Receptor kinase-like protein Xa21 [Euphorbia peplus]|nr:Receptor kinase-like protein Xa21 [Euphorbia peplus]